MHVGKLREVREGTKHIVYRKAAIGRFGKHYTLRQARHRTTIKSILCNRHAVETIRQCFSTAGPKPGIIL
jgi:hypothetical protein